MNTIYLETARLLARIAPFVFTDGVFGLKGGTAINLFIRDMPRLSVDLDLVFLDYRLPRDQAFRLIADSLQSIAAELDRRGFRTHLAAADPRDETKLLVRQGAIEVKIEVNRVMRGSLYPANHAALTPRARSALLMDLEIPVLALEDVYGGKLVAAMDRQHPRDLFDVMQLFANEGITPGIRRAFVVYLAGHNRPLDEVLFPVFRDISFLFDRHFQGMTTEPVALADLLAARERMTSELRHGLDGDERAFLRSLVRNAPEWDRLGFEHIEHLPAIRWKLHNLQELQRANPRKFAQQAEAFDYLLADTETGWLASS